jgi:hypothetical protein
LALVTSTWPTSTARSPLDDREGPDETLEWSPDWAVKRIDDLGKENGALITIHG